MGSLAANVAAFLAASRVRNRSVDPECPATLMLYDFVDNFVHLIDPRAQAPADAQSPRLTGEVASAHLWASPEDSGRLTIRALVQRLSHRSTRGAVQGCGLVCRAYQYS
jgi:hypothetical protein